MIILNFLGLILIPKRKNITDMTVILSSKDQIVTYERDSLVMSKL